MDNNLLPTITKPTRISKSSATLIDNILISEKLAIDYRSHILVDDISDHLPCLITLKNLKGSDVNQTKISRIINEKSITKIKGDLNRINWNEVILDNNTTDLFHSFHGIVLESLNKHAPKKLVTNKPKKYTNPWMSKGLKRSLLKSKKLYQKSLSDPKETTTYKQYMSVLRKCKRKLKLTYYQNKCIEFKHNGRKMWELINKINGKIKDKTCIIDYLTVDNIKQIKGTDIANSFAKYFSEVGKNFANKISAPRTHSKNI